MCVVVYLLPPQWRLQSQTHLNYLPELPVVLYGPVVHHDELVLLVRRLWVRVQVAHLAMSRPSEKKVQRLLSESHLLDRVSRNLYVIKMH